MKKKSPPYAIIIAAVLGFVAIFAAFKWKQNQDALAAAKLAQIQADNDAKLKALEDQHVAPPPPTAANMRNVYYATQPVEAGAKISEAFFEKKATPVDILPDAYSDKDDIVGFYAVRSIEKGDPLTPRNIGKTLPYLSTRISPGMRALSLPILNAQYNNTGGFAVDDDMVDLLFTSTTKDNILIKTEFVLQNVKVLYVPGPKIESEQLNGINPAPPPGDAISITFEVTPEQAQALLFLSEVKPDHGGHFSMILRSKRDKSELKFKPFDSDTYAYEFQKVQKMSDKSQQRVQELAAKIAAEEAAEKKTQGSQGNTNETTPTPPVTP